MKLRGIECSVTGEHDIIDEFVVPPKFYNHQNPQRFARMYAFLTLTRRGLTIYSPSWGEQSQSLRDEAMDLMADIKTVDTVADIGAIDGQ